MNKCWRRFYFDITFQLLRLIAIRLGRDISRLCVLIGQSNVAHRLRSIPFLIEIHNYSFHSTFHIHSFNITNNRFWRLSRPRLSLFILLHLAVSFYINYTVFFFFSLESTEPTSFFRLVNRPTSLNILLTSRQKMDLRQSQSKWSCNCIYVWTKFHSIEANEYCKI